MRYGRRTLVGLRTDDIKAVSIERLCLSLLMSNNLLLKGNKGSYLNQFCECRVFRIRILVVYFWTMYITPAQLAVTAEYTDCISTECKEPSNDSAGYDIEQSGVEAPVMLSFGECRIPLYCSFTGSLA